jgi:hypothetical protein
MEGDLNFFKVAREVRRQIYEGNLVRDIAKTNDYIWYCALEELAKSRDAVSPDRREILRADPESI